MNKKKILLFTISILLLLFHSEAQELPSFYPFKGFNIGVTVYVRNEVYAKDPMSIVLNFAIEYGKFGPDNTTPFPSQMEIDWVRYYKRAPCNNNIVITNASQCLLDDNVYNVLIGKSVEINCDFNIPNGKQLNIIAKNSITLKPGFHAEAGAVFSSQIDPSICETTSMILNESSDTENMNEKDFSIYKNSSLENEETILSEKEENKFNVNIYPNPNQGSFTIEFDVLSEYKKLALKIMTEQGQILYSMENVLHSSTTIDLSKYPKGIYLLSLYNKETFEILVYKIIRL